MNYDEEWAYFTGKVREIRESKGMSLQLLSDLTGIDSSNLSKIETRAADGITFMLMVRIAEVLGVKLSDLVR